MHCLVIDDEWLTRGGTAKAIESILPSVTISEAASLPESFVILERCPNIDLIVLDLNLGGSAGVDTLKQLRKWCMEREISPRIVVLSAAGEENPDLVLEVLEEQGTGYIQKNTPEKIFQYALSITLEGGVFIPERIIQQLRERNERRVESKSSTKRDVNFTAREREIAALLIQGLTYKQIAQKLTQRDRKIISDQTVRTHVNNIAWKLGITGNLPPKAGVMAEISRLGLKFPDTRR
jgi:DNA-binding NarL/FixJ family response regulator